MQRAAASDKSRPLSTPRTPGSEPPPKRRRTGDNFDLPRDSPATPTSVTTPTYPERSAVTNSSKTGTDTPLSYELKSYAGEHYETEWVLDTQMPFANGQSTNGHHNEFSSEDDIWSTSQPTGVQTYGAFKKKRKSTTNASTPQSLSKSARRNAAQKRHTNDDEENDLSSLSSSNSDASSNTDSDNASSELGDLNEPDTYSNQRAQAATHKAKDFSTRHPQSRSKKRKPRTQTNESGYMHLDNDDDRPREWRGLEMPSRGNYFEKYKGKDKKAQAFDYFHARQDRDRQNGGGHGGGNRKKKRKTM
jgi:hypothetical protein